jgi:hypothetical protein
LEGTGIRRNPEESGGIHCKRRNSCPAEIPAKIPVKAAKKQEFLRPSPKARFLWFIPPKNTGKKEILRNPGRNGFLVQKINS